MSVVRRGLLPAILILLAIPVLIHPLPFFPDDALFYPQIAWHIVQGHGSTFNGIERTNGYHPLQMLVTIVAMTAAGCRKMLALRLDVAIEFVWLGLAVALIRVVEERRGRSFVPAAGLLLFGYGTALFGLETHLSLAAVAWWLYELDRCGRASADEGMGPWRRFGMASAVVCLARLDNVFLAAAGAIIAVTGEKSPGMLRRAGGIAETALAPLIAYLAWNSLQFGHVMPISGAIKIAFSRLTMKPDNVGILGAIVSVIAVASLIDALFNRDALILATSIGTLLHSACVLLFSTSLTTAFAWYWTVGMMNAALVLDRVSGRRLAPIVSTALIVFALARGWTRTFGFDAINPLRPWACDRFDPETPAFIHGADRSVASNLPADAVLLAVDAPGSLAYFSGRRVVALDGLTNGYRFDRELKEKGLARYAREIGAQYYFGPSPRPGESTEYSFLTAVGTECGAHTLFRSPLTLAPMGEFDFVRADALADFGNSATRGHGHFALWRLSDVQLGEVRASDSDERPSPTVPSDGPQAATSQR